MRCEEANKLIMAHVDGRLGRFKTEKFERHLDACPRCREEYELEVQIASAFSMDTEGIAGPFFVEDVLGNIETALEWEYAQLRVNVAPKVVALAGAAAVVVVTLILWSTGWGAFGETGAITVFLADAKSLGGGWVTGLSGLFEGVYGSLVMVYHSIMTALGTLSAQYTATIAIVTALSGIASVGLIERFRRKFAEELKTCDQ
jgi:hypothetical protein